MPNLDQHILLDINQLDFSVTGKSLFQHLSLSLGRGEKLGILGDNGCGKTTLLQLMAGVIADPTERIRVLGQNPAKMASTRSKIAYLPDQPPLYTEMTVHENLYFYGKLFGPGQDNPTERIARALEKFHLTGHSKTTVTKLSRGFRQRVALACMLMHPVELYLLDEALNTLDAEHKKLAIHALMDEYPQAGLVLCSHHMDDLEQMDRVLKVENGHLVNMTSSAKT